MSEINRGIPENVKPTATIINFEAAKGKLLEEKTKQAQRIQERTQKPQTNRVETDIPAFTQLPPEGNHQSQRIEFITQAGESGENKHPAERQNTLIDFTQAREKRQVNQQGNSPVTAENTNDIPSFLKPDSIDTGEKVVNDSVKTQENNPDDVDRNQEEDNPQNTIESDELTREKEQIKAMGLIGTKLAQFDVPMQKRDEIFESLADDSNAIIKVTSVLNIHPQDSIAILENIAAFRK
jgi:hypothetical protein